MGSSGHYMVRAMGQSQEDFDVFFRNGVVAVGWSHVDFSSFQSAEDLVARVEMEYYKGGSTAPQVVGRRKNQIRRFKRLREQDKVVVPYWGSVRLACATGKERYSSADGGERDLANQHVVEFLLDAKSEPLTVPRDQLSEGLQRRLRVRGTAVADLSEFADEIDKLFQAETYMSTLARIRNDQEQGFKTKLRRLLVDGSSGLKAGGIGLEQLVKELLEADGYMAAIQDKGRFPELADADIEAIKDDHVTSVKLLVQVKHHSGVSDTWGAKQLSAVLAAEPDLFAEYDLVLVTSARQSADLRDYCEAQDIILISGSQLVDWITDALPTLSKRMRLKLRISDVPQVIEDEFAS